MNRDSLFCNHQLLPDNELEALEKLLTITDDSLCQFEYLLNDCFNEQVIKTGHYPYQMRSTIVTLQAMVKKIVRMTHHFTNHFPGNSLPVFLANTGKYNIPVLIDYANHMTFVKIISRFVISHRKQIFRKDYTNLMCFRNDLDVIVRAKRIRQRQLKSGSSHPYPKAS